MEENIAYFARNNPFSREEQKYHFIFQFSYPEYNLNRQYRLIVLENDKLSKLIHKIAAEVGKSMKIKKAEMDKENETDNSKKEESEDKKVYLQRDEVNFFLNEKELDYNITFKSFQNINDNLKFKIRDQTYQMRINMPIILNIELPSAMFVGFPVYPSVFDAVVIDTRISIFDWYKSLDKSKWIHISNDHSYIPNQSDVNHFLKLQCIPKFENKDGEIFEAISSVRIQIFNQLCPFVKRTSHTKSMLRGKSFRVVSYNILADVYAKKDKFSYCPDHALNVDYRKQLIMKELTDYNADIICLQEIDYKVYKSYLKEEICKRNYRNFYNPKTGKAEGLAFFYHNDKFKSLRKNCINLSKEIQERPNLSKLWNKVKQNEAVANKLISQATIYQVVVLQSKSNPADILIIGNTHLFYHPDANHIRLIQTEICLNYTSGIIHQIQDKNKNSKISFIFCGDFNSNHPCGVFDLLTKGIVPENHEDWVKNPEEIVTNIRLTLKKSMKSAYNAPKFTNYTDDFKGCLDYIFYETRFLKLEKVVPLLSEEEMAENIALPSIVVPSDHVALVADFHFT